MPEPATDGWSDLQRIAVALAAVVTFAAGGFALYQAVRDDQECSLSGTAYWTISTEAVNDVMIGWKDAGEFHVITRSAPDGSFSGECGGAPSTFEIVARGGVSPSVGLPCLNNDTNSGIFIDSRGDHSGLQIRVRSC